jgi:hypothetical protein
MFAYYCVDQTECRMQIHGVRSQLNQINRKKNSYIIGYTCPRNNITIEQNIYGKNTTDIICSPPLTTLLQSSLRTARVQKPRESHKNHNASFINCVPIYVYLHPMYPTRCLLFLFFKKLNAINTITYSRPC